MIEPLLLLVGAHVLQPPAPAEMAAARETVRRAAEAERAAIDAAIESRLLGRGYFHIVTDNSERTSATARFQKRLRSIGIPASVGACEWIGLITAGTASGERLYGGACRVQMGSARPATYLICDSYLGGLTLIRPKWFASDATSIELFIRRTCV
jgi:hypothetical protein